MRSKILVTAAAAALFAAAAPPADAALWTGACAVRVTVDFRTPVRAPLGTVAYDLTVAGAVDLDLTKVGTQSCVTTLTGEATGGTFAGGSGVATWSCAAAVAQGTWHQSFDPEGPPGFSGTHVLAGSWGAWTLSVANTSLNVLGAGELTLQAVEATKTPSCALGALDSVTMVGTLAFQDP
ncbi:MAG: hypothetical protein M3323_01380 [Actinomycetota bacterium]|nr:hypothetical protein [Actinomycetota bacterium]